MQGARTIVIGAGASGAVIAARLSEHGDEVLLLEAGPDYPPDVQLPDDLANGKRNALTSHDWGYRHRPNTGHLEVPLPRGRVVGGSSAVNTCIALRGVPLDYDEWAARGLDEWSWAKCLPAFKKLERDLDFGDREWHGASGPLPVRRHRADELVPWQAAFLDACERAGHARCEDTNAPGALGAGPHAMNKVDGVRMSAARCWLDAKTRARPNLRIEANTHVRRVLFSGRRVRAVEVERNGAIEEVTADRIVLCAGAIATPGVLLRSGIGARDEIARLGVTLVADVPAVGARLLDHPGSAFFLLPKPGLVRFDHPLIQCVLRLKHPHREHAGDIQIQAGSVVHLPRFSVPLVSLMIQVGKPRGHGVLRYPNADPHAKPVIESRLFENADDRAHGLDQLEIAASIAEQKPLRDLARAILPPRAVLRRRTWMEKWIRSACDSGYHASGTVPMGREGDANAATDSHGRVRGVEGLVVGDASLMPTIPTANTHLATLMIGERIAGFLASE